MNIAGSTTHLRPLTDDDRQGLRRTKPLQPSIQAGKPAMHPLPAGNQHGVRPPPTEHDKLVKQTETWVAQTFFGTMLKQMRESPFKSDLFSGGRGGQAFGSMYDQRLSERMARGAGAKLVNSIVHRIESRSAAVRNQIQSQMKGT